MSTELPKVIDTRFRSALRRLSAAGRIESVSGTVSNEYEVASILKKRRREGNAVSGCPGIRYAGVRQFPVFASQLRSGIWHRFSRHPTTRWPRDCRIRWSTG
ncbi:hypothetical protein LP414_07500 [Polaromonas sp. P1(28)-13]|nr:hypothetical protein LP414_07500 [Polaromonas sp. P1(28)-13]